MRRSLVAAMLPLFLLSLDAGRPGSIAGQSGNVCVGDCDASGAVLINEVLTMLNIGNGTTTVSACNVGDANGDGTITINEVITAVNLGLDGCLPCSIVLDQEFVLPCRGSDPLCSDTFQTTFRLERKGPVRMRYDAPDAHCSPIRLHVSVDGADVTSSPFLPPEDRTLEIDIGSRSPGEHRLEVQAEVALGGCSRSQLASSWGGEISLWSESCAPALTRRAALLAFPTPTPTPIPICDPEPRSGCRAAVKSSLVIRTGIKMLWKFKDPVLGAELGDPVFGGTQYGLCIYDEVDDVPVLRAHTAVPAGGICPFNIPCWRDKEKKTIYKDIGHRQEGVEKIILKDSRIIFKVTGFRGLPRPVDFVSFFKQDSTVTAQVVNSDGFCWEATFLREHVGRNVPTVYRASKR